MEFVNMKTENLEENLMETIYKRRVRKRWCRRWSEILVSLLFVNEKNMRRHICHIGAGANFVSWGVVVIYLTKQRIGQKMEYQS